MGNAFGHDLAVALLVLGGVGAVALALYGALLCRLDWDLLPAGAVGRVRWWGRHALPLLRLGLLLAALGLAGLLAAP